jgi:hypothetical protein
VKSKQTRKNMKSKNAVVSAPAVIVASASNETQAQASKASASELIAERSKGITTILRKQSTLFDGLHGVNPESVQGMVKLALVVESETLVSVKLKQVMDDLEAMRNESIAYAKDESHVPSILTVENASAGKHDKRKRLTLKIDRKRASHKNIAWFLRLHKAWIALNAEI